MRTRNTAEKDLDYCIIRASGDAEYDNLQRWSEGTSIASASDCNIWANGDGNTVHLTGTTTVTDWGTAPNAGAFMWVICDAATPLTYNSTTNDLNTGGSNYTTSAGDVLYVYARSTSSYKVTIYPYDGKAPATESYTSSAQTITSAGSLTLAHGLSAVPELIQIRLKCTTAEYNYSVNDELLVSPFATDTAGNFGISIVPDSTNINIRYGSATNTFLILNKTTGAEIAATNANWKLIVKAWK